MTGTPTRIDLIRQAGSVREYLQLCREHGIAPDGPPKVFGPTGLPGANVWPDQPAVDADTAVAALEVHHRRGKERTSDEQAAIRRRSCCSDSAEGPDEDSVILHTLGCPNRCAVDTPCLDSLRAGVGSYPCAATRGHPDGDHWVPPAARLAVTR